MEKSITLDLLINYLANNSSFKTEYNHFEKENIEDKFNLKFLEYYNSSKFNKFNDFFKSHVDRVGVYINDSKKNKISLLSSILFCIDDDFCTLDLSDQEFYIKTVINKIKSDAVSRKFKIKNITTQMIISNMKNKKSINNLDIYIYASYFGINIFTFDFETNDISAFYPDNEYNYYKKNIFISKNNDQYNPLVYKNNNGRYFKYNSSILEDIIYNSEIKPFTLSDKQFIICNDWDILLKMYNKKDLSTILIDLDEDKSLLLKQMMDSDSNSDEIKVNNLDYESDETTSLSIDPDFENLTEELNIINEVTNKMEEINSDNISLDDSEEEDVVEVSVVQSQNNELINKLKEFSKSKLLREKKDILVGYLEELVDNKEENFNKNTKKDLVEKILNIISQDI